MIQGFSGGSIVWHKNYVVKVSAGPEQNEKVKSEILRIRHMAREFKNLFDVPHITRNYMDKRGVFCYEMKRINVPRLEDILPTMSCEGVVSVAIKLSSIVNQFSKKAPFDGDQDNENAFIKKKLHRACEYVGDYNWPESDEYNKLIELIDLTPTQKPTFSHGDMAMDNIFYDGTRVTLIDPLSQEFDNFYWDVAKLMQSTLCHWKEIRSDTAISSPSKEQLRFADVVLEEVKCCRHRLVLYLATVLSRIIPYCHTSIQQFQLLSMSIKLLKQYIKGSTLKPIGVLM